MKKYFSILVVTAAMVLGILSEPAAGASAPSKSGKSAPAASGQVAAPSNTAEAALIISLVASLVMANVAALGFAIASNFRRSLSFDAANAWEDPSYLRSLPNILGLLSRTGFQTVWPRRCSPWSMRRFEWRLLRTVQPHLRKRAADFVDRHMSLWIWVESHRHECRRLLRARQTERALECLMLTRVPQKRAGLLAFLRARARQNTPVIIDEETKRQLRLLQNLQVIMREHGYCVSAEFHQRDQLDEALPEQLADALARVSAN